VPIKSDSEDCIREVPTSETNPFEAKGQKTNGVDARKRNPRTAGLNSSDTANPGWL